MVEGANVADQLVRREAIQELVNLFAEAGGTGTVDAAADAEGNGARPVRHVNHSNPGSLRLVWLGQRRSSFRDPAAAKGRRRQASISLAPIS